MKTPAINICSPNMDKLQGRRNLTYEHVLRAIESSWVQIGLKIEVDGKWQKGQPEQQCRDMLGVKSSLSTRPRPNLSPRQVRNLDDPICKSVDKDFNEISIRFICRKIVNHPNQCWSNSHETLLIFRNMWSSLSILGSELRFFFCKITTLSFSLTQILLLWYYHIIVAHSGYKCVKKNWPNRSMEWKKKECNWSSVIQYKFRGVFPMWPFPEMDFLFCISFES